MFEPVSIRGCYDCVMIPWGHLLHAYECMNAFAVFQFRLQLSRLPAKLKVARLTTSLEVEMTRSVMTS